MWELYYLPDDFSQANDLAADNPDKVDELQELLWQEAERNRVLPLLGGMAVFFGMLPPMPTITRFTFKGDVQNIQRGMVPRILGRSYAIEAHLNVPDGGAQGVIVANADFIGGFALWVDGNGLLHHTYSFLGVETYKQVSTKPIPTGDVTVKMLFEADQPHPAAAAVTLWAGDRLIGEGDDAPDRAGRLHVLRRDGHRPRQRPGGRPRLRGQGPLRVHRDGQRGRVRPQASTHDAEMALHEHAQMQAVGQGAAG